MNRYKEIYGLVPMTFQEEIAAPVAIKSTRTAKVEANIALSHIIRRCNAELAKAKNIPELNDGHHAEAVRKYCNCIREALRCLDEIDSIY